MERTQNDYFVMLVNKIVEREPNKDFLAALDEARSLSNNEEWILQHSQRRIIWEV